MNSFWRIFSLELIAFVRSKTLAMLGLASGAWLVVFKLVAKGDGTAEGLRELYVRYSLGGVFLLTLISLLASATASLARERAAKRLQLTLVRPVRYTAVILAKLAAHVLIGAVVLGLAAIAVAVVTNDGRFCYHVHNPMLPSVREEARAMYEAYMADPETPEEIRKAKRERVLRLLEMRAPDHYQTLPTNEVTSWRFPIKHPATLSVRLRFSNNYNQREEVYGVFSLGENSSVVSNITQAILTIPLGEVRTGGELNFENRGKTTLMLRPRRDINLLESADKYLDNLFRAWLELTAVLTLVVAFGLFLSAALGRSVALFTAMVILIVGEMSPSVIEQYPDELGAGAVDRIGLALTRFSAVVTRPVSSFNPLEALSVDECVEWSEVGQAWLVDVLLVPLVLALLAGFALPRKQDEI